MCDSRPERESALRAKRREWASDGEKERGPVSRGTAAITLWAVGALVVPPRCAWARVRGWRVVVCDESASGLSGRRARVRASRHGHEENNQEACSPQGLHLYPCRARARGPERAAEGLRRAPRRAEGDPQEGARKEPVCRRGEVARCRGGHPPTATRCRGGRPALAGRGREAARRFPSWPTRPKTARSRREDSRRRGAAKTSRTDGSCESGSLSPAAAFTAGYLRRAVHPFPPFLRGVS